MTDSRPERLRNPIEIEFVEESANKAWRKIHPGGSQLKEILILKGGKSLVCRVSVDGMSIIGKRSERRDSSVERTVYEQVLPHLPVAALRFYGYVEELDSPFCWLFIEEAHGEPFSPENEEHLNTAARFLVTLHTSAANLHPPSTLPDRDESYYLGLLRRSREIFAKSMPQMEGREQAITMLKSILTQFDSLESLWNQIEKLCETVPRTLVHEDLKAKHVRMRTNENGKDFLAFDWGHAGWGVPAVDFKLFFIKDAWASKPLATYWSVAHQSWPSLTLADVERLAKVGRIFRSIATVYWESLDFISGRPIDQALKNLRRSYHPRLLAAIQDADLNTWNL